VDRGALPDPEEEGGRAPTLRVAPRSEPEETIAHAWREVLGLGEVGAEDNFFDLGGNSVSLVQVHGRLRGVLQSAVTVTDLFRHPTIAALAAFITRSGESSGLEEVRDLAARQREALERQKQLRQRSRPGE